MKKRFKIMSYKDLSAAQYLPAGGAYGGGGGIFLLVLYVFANISGSLKTRVKRVNKKTRF
jgi:hypothetical protein